MRPLFVSFLLLFVVACKDVGKRHLPKSNGRINTIAVVSRKVVWEGSVGDALKTVLQKPVQGLPTNEPLFSLHHIPTNVFLDNMRNSRNIIVLRHGKSSSLKLANNAYAKPQNVIYITGENDENIIRLINEYGYKIDSIFKASEFDEQQKRITENNMDVTSIEKVINLELRIPSTFRIVKKDKDFFWIQRPLPKNASNTSNILVYTLPMNTFPRGEKIAEKIRFLRDSIGEKQIPGREEGMYMITDADYPLEVKHLNIQGRETFETRGMWEVKNFLMAGPFLNYMILDLKNSRVVVVEGFVFAPFLEKRDFIFELEVIAKSITFD